MLTIKELLAIIYDIPRERHEHTHIYFSSPTVTIGVVKDVVYEDGEITCSGGLHIIT